MTGDPLPIVTTEMWSIRTSAGAVTAAGVGAACAGATFQTSAGKAIAAIRRALLAGVIIQFSLDGLVKTFSMERPNSSAILNARGGEVALAPFALGAKHAEAVVHALALRSPIVTIAAPMPWHGNHASGTANSGRCGASALLSRKPLTDVANI